MGHFAGKDIVARLRDAEPCCDGHPCKAKEAKFLVVAAPRLPMRSRN